MESYKVEHLQEVLQLVQDKLTEVSQKEELPQEIKDSTAKTAELAKEAKEQLGKS